MYLNETCKKIRISNIFICSHYIFIQTKHIQQGITSIW